MNTSVERLESDILEVTVTVDAAQVNETVKATYKDLAHKYRFQGFRPGKAPRQIIDSNLGHEAVMGEATNALVGELEPKIKDELNIIPLKDPDYQEMENSVVEGEDFTYKFKVSVRPELTLNSYEPVTIEVPAQGATDAEIDAQVEVFQGYYAEMIDIEGRNVEANDTLFISIKGEENLENFNIEDQMYEMGKGNMPESFDESIVGIAIDETKKISFELPTDEESEEEPKVATAEVTIKRIVNRVLPELNDEFAKNNFGFESIAEMRTQIAEDIASRKENDLPTLKENRVTAAAAERLEGEPSAEYINTVQNELAQNFLQQLQGQGMTLDGWLASQGMDINGFMADLKAQATDVSRESLALDAIVREREITATTEELNEEFKASGVEDWADLMVNFVETGRMPGVRNSIERNKAVEWLLETATITTEAE